MGDYYEEKSRKRLVVIGVSSLILVAMVVAVTVGFSFSSNQANGEHEVTASTKAIKSLCAPTEFQQTCEDSLRSGGANDSTDVKQLIQIGFNAAVDHIKKASQESALLKELEKDPRSSQALDTCKELADTAVSDLRRSLDKLSTVDLGSDLQPLVDDIKTWLSAAVTHQEACLDAFEGTTGTSGDKMRQALNISAQITRNGLAMVDEFSTVLSSLQIPNFSRRRLLSQPFEMKSRRRLLQAAVPKANFVVAQDGSGDAKTINEALEKIPKNSATTYVLYIKKGVYNEIVRFNKTLPNLLVVGDGPTQTKITGGLNFIDGTPTFKTATVAVLADNFTARDIGFENSAGADKHQAVALRVQADKAIFYNCQIDGYQDTLYTHAYRQFYRDCVISGTIDYIFGDAAAIFQNCTMVVRKPLSNQQCIVTAQGRKDQRQSSAIVIQNSRFVADPAYAPMKATNKAFLGRPWKEFSRTIIMDSFIDDSFSTDGWLPWEADFGLKTCYYSEFSNYGPGSDKSKRVKWEGVKIINEKTAISFTPGTFIFGDNWIIPTGVTYDSGRKPAPGGYVDPLVADIVAHAPQGSAPAPAPISVLPALAAVASVPAQAPTTVVSTPAVSALAPAPTPVVSTPAPAVSALAPAPTTVASAPAVSALSPAPTTVASAPAVSALAPAPTTGLSAPAPEPSSKPNVEAPKPASVANAPAPTPDAMSDVASFEVAIEVGAPAEGPAAEEEVEGPVVEPLVPLRNLGDAAAVAALPNISGVAADAALQNISDATLTNISDVAAAALPNISAVAAAAQGIPNISEVAAAASSMTGAADAAQSNSNTPPPPAPEQQGPVLNFFYKMFN